MLEHPDVCCCGQQRTLLVQVLQLGELGAQLIPSIEYKILLPSCKKDTRTVGCRVVEHSMQCACRCYASSRAHLWLLNAGSCTQHAKPSVLRGFAEILSAEQHLQRPCLLLYSLCGSMWSLGFVPYVMINTKYTTVQQNGNLRGLTP